VRLSAYCHRLSSLMEPILCQRPSRVLDKWDVSQRIAFKVKQRVAYVFVYAVVFNVQDVF
ncbi:hypothetical protein QTO17_37980, partial [Vibrio owensii]